MAAKKSIKIEVEDLDANDSDYGSGRSSSLKSKAKKAVHAESEIKAPFARHLAKERARADKEESPEAKEDEEVEAQGDDEEEKQEEVVEDEKDVEATPVAKSSFFSKNLGRKIKEDAAEAPSILPQKKEAVHLTPQKPAGVKGKADIEARLSASGNIIKDLVQKEKEKQETHLEHIGERINGGHSIKIYRKIAYFFIGITVLLLLAVLYFGFVTVKIVLIPNQERISNNLIFDIYDTEKNSQKSGVPGLVQTLQLEESLSLPASGEEVVGKEAVGKVTIINNYNKNQPLVATTRLVPAGEPDKLFRIKNTVNVPAGGSIEAEIYADEPSPEMAVAPGKFSIPGLWAGLQDKIYAESNEAVVYRQKVEKYVASEDFEAAKQELGQRVLIKAKESIAVQEGFEYLYKLDDNSVKVTYTQEKNEKSDTLDAKMTAKVLVVGFEGNTAGNLAEQKFAASLPQNKKIISFDRSSMIYALNNYDTVSAAATINATFEGKVTLNDDPGIVDVDKLLGLSKAQVEGYLDKVQDIAGYEVQYSPSFLPDFLKRVPPLKDKVIVEVRSQ